MVLGGTRPKDFDKSELKPTRWNSFVEDYAKDHHIPYTEAIVDWRVSNAYRANNNVAWDRKRNVWLKNPEPLRRHFTQEEIARMTDEEVLEAMEEIWENEEEEEPEEQPEEQPEEDLVGITLEELENMTNEEVIDELEELMSMKDSEDIEKMLENILTQEERENMEKEDVNVAKKKKKENLTEGELEMILYEYEEMTTEGEELLFFNPTKIHQYIEWFLKFKDILKILDKNKERIGLDNLNLLNNVYDDEYRFHHQAFS